jgi:uncharacterized repeat protein (TIGR01451 family)
MVGMALLAAVLTAAPAPAQEARPRAAVDQTGVDQKAEPRIVVGVTMQKEVVVIDEQGREQVVLQDAATTRPGDTLVYRIHCANKGAAPALNARVVDPVPAGTQLIPGSLEAPGLEVQASVDGGRTFESYPVRRPVTRPDGSREMEEVDPGAYTHVRWTAREPLAPGDGRTALFKVKVR